MITVRITNAIKKYKSDADLSGFEIFDDGTLPLNRMDNMMSLNFDELLENEPVQLSESYGYYRILNGRHRIARAIIEGRKTINAKIM
jgi:hypothetical protein